MLLLLGVIRIRSTTKKLDAPVKGGSIFEMYFLLCHARFPLGWEAIYFTLYRKRF